jgi:hypothetical protein
MKSDDFNSVSNPSSNAGFCILVLIAFLVVLTAGSLFALEGGGSPQNSQPPVVQIQASPETDISPAVNSAIASLHGGAGTIQLPAGTYMQSKQITVTGNAIHIIGASAGTVLHYPPSNFHLIDSADSTDGWTGSGTNLMIQTTMGDDHPIPIEGDAYLEVDTENGAEREIIKSIPATNLAAQAKIGIWLSFNLTMGPPHKIEFFCSDGTHTAYWQMQPVFFHDQWSFFTFDPTHPSGNDGSMPNLQAVTSIGFRKLFPGGKYFFGPISSYTPTGPSVVFENCVQCSLSNIDIHWEPASASDSVLAITQGSRGVEIENVHITGGASGFSFQGNSSGNICRACTAQSGTLHGFYLQDNTTSNQLLNVQANRNANGLVIESGSSYNIVSSSRFVENNNSAILIKGSDNQITNVDMETWMSIGMVLSGAIHNSITGLTARSAVGETAVQFFSKTAHNTLSQINIQQAGGNGLDLGGGAEPTFDNTIDSLVTHNTGSSSWHGGAGATSEGRGICVCGTNDDVLTHVQIYDAGQLGHTQGAQGILFTHSSGTRFDDLLIEHSQKEGISMWNSNGTQMHNVRLINNGSSGKYFGMTIDPTSENTTIDGICFAGNSGGALQDRSHSTTVRNAKTAKRQGDCP